MVDSPRKVRCGSDDTPFQSFFQAGFECASHRRPDGRRLDLLAATGHDQHCEQDYRAVAPTA